MRAQRSLPAHLGLVDVCGKRATRPNERLQDRLVEGAQRIRDGVVPRADAQLHSNLAPLLLLDHHLQSALRLNAAVQLVQVHRLFVNLQ